MDIQKTRKKMNVENPVTDETFKVLLEDSAREAYSRPWHRIERGLRLNRLRIFVEDIAPQYGMSKEEKDDFFVYLQKALDKKLLNTLKVVLYDQTTQRISTIKGLELKRNAEGVLKWAFNAKKPRTDTTGTRKKKKEDEHSVSTIQAGATTGATISATISAMTVADTDVST
jgi:hypothetical protein